MLATANAESFRWLGKPDERDDSGFIRIVDQMLDALAAGSSPDIYLIRLDNWFGPRWFGFAGTLVNGRLGVHTDLKRADMSLPPFHPNRVRWERKFAKKDGESRAAELSHPLHRIQPTGVATTRALRSIAEDAHYLWFSGNSAQNGRGILLGATLRDGEQRVFYVGLSRQTSTWRIDDKRGTPPVPRDALELGGA